MGIKKHKTSSDNQKKSQRFLKIFILHSHLNLLRLFIVLIPLIFLTPHVSSPSPQSSSIFSLSISPAHAADKNGVSPTTISLPTGPGSIEGMGGAFQPMLNTGMATYEVDITLPDGVSGHTPRLTLSYDSGLGDGPAGIGWRIGPGSISRQTEKGIPLYVDGPNGLDDDHDGDIDEPDELDTFIGFEGEELVLLENGTYRARIEGAFILYKRLGNSWEAYLKDGTILKFGLTAAGRLANGDKIYRWLLEKSADTNGNVICYTYTHFPGSDHQIYLKEIRYGPGSPPWQTYYFAALTYQERPDWRKDYRSGFLIKTTKRLSRIDIGIQGAPPPQCTIGDWNNDGESDALIRCYSISYQNSALHCSYLAQITRHGADANTFLPPLFFSYSLFDPNISISAKDALLGSLNEPSTVMDSQLVEIIDLNRDGLPDLLKTDLYGGRHTGYLNLGTHEKNICWDTPKDIASQDGLALHLALSENKVHLADMDGDGLSDLVHNDNLGQLYYFHNQGHLSWDRRKTMSIQDTSPPAPFANPQVKTADLDFDKRIDIIKSSENGYAVWFNLEEGKYSREVRTPGALHHDHVILFADTGVHLADMNGDRLSDVVKITPTRVIYCPNSGHGFFEPSIVLPIPDQILTDGPNGHLAIAELQDINGDGLSDLVIERAAPNQLWYWLNCGNDTFSPQHILTDLPSSYGCTMVTRWADINGNGTTDLIYADSSALPRLRTLDIGALIGGSEHPNLLTGIDNGLGLITRITYKSSAEYYLNDFQQGAPWTSTLPFPVSVVACVETTPSLDLDGIPGNDLYVKEYTYRNGYYDDLEKTFRGFAEATVIEQGDATAPTQITTHTFFTGGPDGLDNDQDGLTDEVSPEGYREDEPLKGMIRETEVRSEDNLLYNKEETTWSIKNLLVNPQGIEVRFAYSPEKNTRIYEGTDTPETLKITYLYDDYGNLTEEKNYGALSITGDELFTFTTYIHDPNRWIIDRPKTHRQTDAAGNKVAETRSYYDGPEYIGLGPGLLERGNLTRQEGWVKETHYVNLVRNRYDPYGNITGIMDGNGNVREIEYDQTMHIFPVRETIHIGEGKPDLIVTASYHLGFGAMTQSADFNGHSTDYAYDLFGRLVTIIKPGDSSLYPTQSFIYTMPDPERGLIYAYDEEGTLTLKPAPCPDSYLVSSVKTCTRENVGLPGTFDSIQYIDGLKRKLALVEEGEQGYIVKEASLFNARGTTRFSFLPYATGCADYQPPFIGAIATGAFETVVPATSIPAMGASSTIAPETNATTMGSFATETRYDATGRERALINPPDREGKITLTITQYLPLQKTVTDENNNSKTFINDGLKRLIQVHEYNQGETYITQYEYDPLDNMLKITDAQGNVKTMDYDGLKRKTYMNDPDRGEMFSTYDDAGNLVKTIDNKAQSILYSYDGANRMISEDYLDEAGLTPDVTYHYDISSEEYPQASNLKGEMAWVEDLSGGQFFSYDTRGNTVWTVKRINQVREGGVVTEGAFRDFTTAMTYDALDRVTSLTYPDGDSIVYTYNNRTLLESIPGVVETIDYYPSGQISSISYANRCQTSYAYDPRQRLIHLETKSQKQENALLQDLSYAFDGVSNITAITDGRPLPPDAAQNATQAFQYDDLSRLTQADGAGYGIITFQYDKIGNMTGKKSPDSPDPRHITDPLINLGQMGYGGSGGSSNRSGRLPCDPPGPHAITSTESGFLYDYDENGNMTNHATGDSYSWDFKDRLVRAQKEGIEKGSADGTLGVTEEETGEEIKDGTNDGTEEGTGEGTNTRYVYDYTGHRIIKEVNDSSGKKLTRYISNEYEIREGQEIKYIFAGTRRVAQIEGKIPDPDAPMTSVTQVLTFPQGWNFFSLFIEPEDPNIETLLAPIKGKFSEIWAYEARINDAEANGFIGYIPGEGENDLKELHAQRGYLINMNTQASLHVTGTRAKNSIPLNSGWNLIGNVSNSAVPVEEVLASIEGDYIISSIQEDHLLTSADGDLILNSTEEEQTLQSLDEAFISIWSYDPESGQWECFDPAAPPFINDLQQMEPGKAYWIQMNAERTLSYRDSSTQGLRFFHPDHLGSSNLITDADGKVVENTEFYPFGRPRYEGRIETGSPLPYKYTSKELDKESGLMYYGARYYDPVVGRFMSVDPIDLKDNTPQMLNPYVYVLNNPIILIDPTGAIPTALEGAEISQHVYEGQKGQVVAGTGWTMIEVYTYSEVPGFRAGLYSKTVNGVTEYTLANAGTDIKDFKLKGDWVQNFKQPFGASEDMKKSISLAKAISQHLGQAELTFVGHSKGGAEAAGNALATKRNALLYNPAAISAKSYGLDTKSYTGINNIGMTAYIVKGDVLNTFLNSWLAEPIDKAVYLPRQSNSHIKNHLMGSMIEAIISQNIK